MPIKCITVSSRIMCSKAPCVLSPLSIVVLRVAGQQSGKRLSPLQRAQPDSPAVPPQRPGSPLFPLRYLRNRQNVSFFFIFLVFNHSEPLSSPAFSPSSTSSPPRAFPPRAVCCSAILPAGLRQRTNFSSRFSFSNFSLFPSSRGPKFGPFSPVF